MLRLRRSREERDADALVALEELSLPDPWNLRMMTAYLDDGSASVWIAEHEELPVGFAIFQRAADEVELLRLGVDPAWRRVGVGGELVARGLAEAIDQGCSAGFLEVRADNLPARRLYERLGFLLVGRRARYYSDGTEACVYRRDLSAVRG